MPAGQHTQLAPDINVPYFTLKILIRSSKWPRGSREAFLLHFTALFLIGEPWTIFRPIIFKFPFLVASVKGGTNGPKYKPKRYNYALSFISPFSYIRFSRLFYFYFQVIRNGGWGLRRPHSHSGWGRPQKNGKLLYILFILKYSLITFNNINF